MGNPERIGGHPHRHRDDFSRTCALASFYSVFLYFLVRLCAGLMLLPWQLARARNGTRFTNAILIRVVRLTVETNALSGTFASIQPTRISISPMLPPLSWRGYCQSRTQPCLPCMCKLSRLTTSPLTFAFLTA
jgi:hypothetical protein